MMNAIQALFYCKRIFLPFFHISMISLNLELQIQQNQTIWYKITQSATFVFLFSLQVHIHGKERDGLFEEIPADVVPEDLGGNAKPYDGELVADQICDLMKRCYTADYPMHYL